MHIFSACHGRDAKECLNMRSKIISILVLFCMFVAPAAQAAPHPGPKPGHHPSPQAGPPPGPKPGHHPGPQPRPILRPYHRPYYRPGYYEYPRYRNYENYRYYNHYRHNNSNDIWISIGAGLLIGSIISNMNRAPEYYPPAGDQYPGTDRDNYSYSESYERERQISEIRAIVSQNAKTEAARASRMAVELGTDQAAAALARAWESEGKRVTLDGRSGLQVLKVSGFYDGSQMTYTFLPENRKVYVKISVPELSISAEESEYYAVSSGQSPAYYSSEGSGRGAGIPNDAPSASVSSRGSAIQYAGFELQGNSRSQSGHLIVGEVAKGTAAYYAGIRQGDLLLSADQYDSRNFDAAWFNGYISDKYSSRAMVRLRISRNGVEKKIEIRL